MYIQVITVVSIVLSLAQAHARGPHHPRGAKIVKKHVHYRPTKDMNEKLTEDIELLHDKEHIQEHLEEMIAEPDLSKMTDEELEFYYFQVHDTDNNSKLDGLEILQAILHTDQHHDEEDDEEEDETESKKSSAKEFDYYVELIDQVLKEDDSNSDGYLSYSEYVSSRREARINDMKNSPVVQMIT